MSSGLPKTLYFKGKSVSLDHLRSYTHLLPGHGPNGVDLVVRVTFTSHVFSVSEGSGTHDFLDEAGNKRFFCPERYAFSLNLETAVRNVLDLNVFTWEEKDRNRVANLAVLTSAKSQLISGVHNVLIYYLHQSRVDGIHVEMLVKSCYVKAINFDKRPRRERIRVFVKTVCFKGGRVPRN